MHQEIALSRALVGKGNNIDFEGLWKNKISSSMVITQNDNLISGRYESSVSSSGKKTQGNITGWVNGDLISLCVHWDDFQAITSWVGQLVPEVSPYQIKTLWQMTRQVKEGDEWASINAGSDLFTRQTST